MDYVCASLMHTLGADGGGAAAAAAAAAVPAVAAAVAAAVADSGNSGGGGGGGGGGAAADDKPEGEVDKMRQRLFAVPHVLHVTDTAAFTGRSNAASDAGAEGNGGGYSVRVGLTCATASASVARELAVFWLYRGMLEGLGLARMYEPGLYQLKLCCFQFDRLFEALLPRLYRHFDEQGVSVEMFVIGWFQVRWCAPVSAGCKTVACWLAETSHSAAASAGRPVTHHPSP
jgi:hypothetical protein